MKNIFLVLLYLFFNFANAKEIQTSELAGSPAQSFYLEIVPGESKSLKFETVNANYECKDKFHIQEFESTKEYPSIEVKKNVPVKIINLYVKKSLQGCDKKGSKNKISAKYDITKSNRMQHIYITTDSEVQLFF
jgi:hypothetical protein